MSEHLDRDEVMRLLDVLGDEDDAEVLAAARQLNAMVVSAGVDWDDLLRDVNDENRPDSIDTDADEVESDFRDEGQSSPQSGKDQTTLELIDKLLARSNCSDALREELEEYKIDIAEGEFETRDHEYVRALHARLMK